MAEASIPVDPANPGQVFACLGLMEAAEVLLGGAEGCFDWTDGASPRFTLRANGESDPVEEVLAFLASTQPKALAHVGWQAKVKDKDGQKNSENKKRQKKPDDAQTPPEQIDTSPAVKLEDMALPIRLGGGNRPGVMLSHWADGSSRKRFKLYSGNRSAKKIAQDMLGLIETLFRERHNELLERPLDVLVPMGGSFNFDPRGAWAAIDAGYSPNEHKHEVEASPVVELLAAWGMEHARPIVESDRHVRYAVWGRMLPVMLARPALAGVLPSIPARHFRFSLASSGENKIVTFAQEEPAP